MNIRGVKMRNSPTTYQKEAKVLERYNTLTRDNTIIKSHTHELANYKKQTSVKSIEKFENNAWYCGAQVSLPHVKWVLHSCSNMEVFLFGFYLRVLGLAL